MVTATSVKKRPSPIVMTGLPRVSDIAVLCPGCKAFETLSFSKYGLMQTRKYKQVGNAIYHDCGCGKPCRLYY